MEVTTEEMKRIEHDADARGLSYPRMMENAGTAAAEALLAKKAIRSAAVFCGTGNNGGDGLVLARVLREHGVLVHIVLVGGEPRTQDAWNNYYLAQKLWLTIVNVEDLGPSGIAMLRRMDAVVDAVCGTGFHGALRPAARKACDIINGAGGFRLALDLPSGLHADTGEAAEGTVKADMTVTFHAPKPCHRLAPVYCGEVQTASIGIESL